MERAAAGRIVLHAARRGRKLLRRFGIDIYALKTETLQSDLFGEALTMALNGRELLQIGTVSRNIRRKLDVKQDVFYLEMNFEALVKSTKSTGSWPRSCRSSPR